MIESIYTFIEKYNLIQANDTVVVGFSGGPDSLFLLHILDQLRIKKKFALVAAHLNHEWRPESQDEAVFCRNVAEQLKIPFVMARMSELNFDKKFSGSQEELGRRARRFFLETVQISYQAHSIALAHHFDDQEETFFIRLIRGSTIAGLAGMKPHDGYYIRPLLEIQKKDIIAWLNKHTIAYITDPGNMSDKYLRTRIRNHVIPALRQSDKRFDSSFKRTLHHIQETDNFLEILTQEVFVQVARQKENQWVIDLEIFFALHYFLQQRILVRWLILCKVPFILTEKFLLEILRFLQKPGSKKHALHRHWSVVKVKNIAYINYT